MGVMPRLPRLLLVLFLAHGGFLAGCQVEDWKSGSAGKPGQESTASLCDDDSAGRTPVPASAAPGPAAASMRIVSLKAVDRILAACPTEALCADSLFLRLAGITAVAGIAFDERTRD